MPSPNATMPSANCDKAVVGASAAPSNPNTIGSSACALSSHSIKPPLRGSCQTFLDTLFWVLDGSCSEDMPTPTPAYSSALL
ncbi:hypothetical protein D3C71_2120830 [compost metagenome]